MIRSPPASSLPAGALPSPNSAMRPPAKATQPRSITRSASTMRALPRMVSCFEVISHSSFMPLCRGGKRCHVDDPVSDQMANFIAMDDRCHRNALTLLLFNQLDDDRAIGRVERGRGFIQQQNRQVGDETMRNVHPLLFAAGEC